MNHTRFTSLLQTRYPTASAHSNYSNARIKNAVTITFQPGGKCYDYSGSYTDILEKLGIMREWYVRSSGGTIISRHYTEGEAQMGAAQEIKRDGNYRAMATEQGYYVPASREYIVEHRKAM